MTELLPKVLAFLDKGYSVIPVGLDKKPLIQWKPYQTKKATVEELVQWFTIDYPEAQIGIITGEVSNLTVIDVEHDGDFNLVKDKTYTVQTGGGGKHYYFTYDKDFKNVVRIFPSVDIRSEGGYVLAAGSKTSKGAYTVLDDVTVGQMSTFTRTAFLGAKKKDLPWYASSGQSSYVGTQTTGLEYDGAGEGSRNDSMTKFAGTLHAKLHPSLWATVGWQLFEQANLKNTPPLPSFELRMTWNSISTRETQQNPGGRSYDGNKEKTWGPAPEKTERKKPQFEDSLSDDEIPEEDAKETLHVSEVAELQKIDTDHTYPLDMKPFDDALLGGFSLGDLVVVAGQSGHGKTSLIQDWSVTLSSGGTSQREKLPSLWFSYEVLAKPLWQKFQGMGATADTPLYMPRFNETGEVDWVIDVIEKAIEKWGIKVVCIDHLGFLRAPKGNYSNSADAVTNTVRALKKLAVKHGLIILLPVHIRKTNSKTPDLNDIRDSLGIAQEADTVFFIGREKDGSGLPSNQAKLWLVKNRKSGIAVSALFDYEFGRYYYNANETSRQAQGDVDQAAAKSAYDSMGE